MASDGLERRFSPSGGLRVAEVLPASSGTRLAGYAVRFGERSVDLGGFVEIIHPSAADRTIREKIDVRAFHSHNSDLLLGRLSNRTLAIRKDPQGLYVEVDVSEDTSFGRDVVAMVRRGDLTQMSFGFRVERDGDEWANENGTLVRTIYDATIFEVSTVAAPAYPTTSIGAREVDTSVAMKSLEAHRQGRLPASRVAYLRRLHRQRLVGSTR